MITCVHFPVLSAWEKLSISTDILNNTASKTLAVLTEKSERENQGSETAAQFPNATSGLP